MLLFAIGPARGYIFSGDRHVTVRLLIFNMDTKKLAVIHIVKKELNLSEKEYRDILRNAAGVESAKDLDEKKFRKLMNAFMRSTHYRLQSNGITLRQKYFIRNLYQDLGWDRKHRLYNLQVAIRPDIAI